MDTNDWISHIHSEVEYALDNLYSILAYYECVRAEGGLDIVNRNPGFWRRFVSNYQRVLFINLGRLFDGVEGAKSFPKFQGHCIQNYTDFSAASLERRRIEQNGGNRPEYMDNYLLSCVTPSKEEVAQLFSSATSINHISRDIYQRIRSKVIAHAIWTQEHEFSNIFKATSYHDVEKILLTVLAIVNNIWMLFHNGKLYNKPLLVFNYQYKDEAYKEVRSAFSGI